MGTCFRFIFFMAGFCAFCNGKNASFYRYQWNAPISKAYGLLLRFPFPCVMMGRVTLPSRGLTPNIPFNKEVNRMKGIHSLVLLVLMLC